MPPTVTLPVLTCRHCGYRWVPRPDSRADLSQVAGERITVTVWSCPKCSNPRWNEEKRP